MSPLPRHRRHEHVPSTVSRRLEVAVVSVPPVPPRGPDDLDPTGIRALLSAMPDPGPMPADLVQRIQASIAAEQAARAGGVRPEATVVPLHAGSEHAGRRQRWQRFVLVAAAAAVAAVAVPALLSGSPSTWLTSLSAGTSQGSSASSMNELRSTASINSSSGAVRSDTGNAPGVPIPGASPLAVARVTIYASGTAYTAAGFARQAEMFVTHQLAPVAPPGSKAPGLGQAATATGLAPCLTALRLDSTAQVKADLATFEGRSAVVIVATSSTTPTTKLAYAVDRGCTSGTVQVLAGPVDLP
jgi:hypothetical protein